ncbi:helix-turn-helix domain-containing protein [Subtercola sp. YIM 133946]|uniref:helix-turn-helix domain-containing protein n=1 Tax=Subtercola sp. YIM 133946 TaxID=3118909 RepID=UPI002F9576D2
MQELAELIGIDPTSPDQLRAAELVRRDREFLRSLVKVRESQGFTQQEVADRLGITQPSVASFERYDSDPKLSTVRRYALAVGALVGHAVAADKGQLANSGEWVSFVFAGRQEDPAFAPVRTTRTVPAAKVAFALSA